MRNRRFTLSLILAVVLSPTLASAKDDDVQLRTDLPFGNAVQTGVRKAGQVMEIRFTPDPHGGPESLWFSFRVSRKRSGNAPLGKIRIILECPETMLGGSRPGTFRPVFRISGGDWERTGAPELLELPDGRRQAAWSLNLRKPWVDFAFAYPYGHEDLDRLIRETGPFWRADTIGVTQGGRPLVRLSNDYGQAKGKRPGVYLIARQHSGEVSGSWILDGVLRRFAELGEISPLVWGVPLANLDGVEQGDYGKDNFPYDLNRAWGNPPMRHETLVIRQDMRRWALRCQPLAGIDFHAPGAGETEGIYAFLQTAEKAPEVTGRATDLAAAIADSLKSDFRADPFARSANYRSRWNTPNFVRFCQEEIQMPGLGLETPYAMIQDQVMTREKYREAGRRIADAIIEYGKERTIGE